MSFSVTRNYRSPTRVIGLKVAPNMADQISIKDSVALEELLLHKGSVKMDQLMDAYYSMFWALYRSKYGRSGCAWSVIHQ